MVKPRSGNFNPVELETVVFEPASAPEGFAPTLPAPAAREVLLATALLTSSKAARAEGSLLLARSVRSVRLELTTRLWLKPELVRL